MAVCCVCNSNSGTRHADDAVVSSRPNTPSFTSRRDARARRADADVGGRPLAAAALSLSLSLSRRHSNAERPTAVES